LNVSCAQSDCVLFTVWLGPNAYNRPRNLGPFVDMHCQQCFLQAGLYFLSGTDGRTLCNSFLDS
jgi:hypothetical protein